MRGLRRVASADLPQILALEAGGFAEGAWGEAAVVGALADPYGLHLCLVEDGVMQAVLIGQVLFERAELLRVVVAASGRRAGRGRALLRAFIDQCAVAGAEALWLEVRASNAPARALYVAEGFTLAHQRAGYYADGEDALLYCRPLGPPPG